MNRILKFNRGFSMVEILISILTIGVILILYQATLGSVFLTRVSNHREIALRIANHKMEELRATAYASLPASGLFTDAQLSSLPSGSAAMTISDFNNKTKQVGITVSWLEPQSSTSSAVSLYTLITQTGGL